jgi:predicted glycosyltransferase
VKVWVDLVNSPQVLVLRPIIDELQARGHEVVITTRDFAQTVQLANQAGLSHTSFGRHGGNSRASAIRANLERVIQLVRFIRSQRVDLALSHNSYSQAVAARLLGIPFVTMMDYEHHQANHIAFRLAKRVLVPEVFPEESSQKFGAAAKTIRYPGLKEEIYLGQFVPNPAFIREAGLPLDRTIVVARPPGYWADYYHGKGDLFSAAIDRVLADPSAFVVFLPRIASQAVSLQGVAPDRYLIPPRPLNGPNLLYYADLAISAGGTMNREAAVLGTPAYTVFEGALGAVDRSLVARGRLKVVTTRAEVAAIEVEKKSPMPELATRGRELTQFITNAILGEG